MKASPDTMEVVMDTTTRLLPQSRARYEVLDGLRGIAAMLVVCFHLLEAHAENHFSQMLNHAYLAVDFFFVLSGFVIGYAYDARWGEGGLSTWGFVRRRLIRLQPMIAFGTLLGLAVFPFTVMAEGWEGRASVGAVMLCALLGALMIPVTPSHDVRGWEENYPLNGSQWSLFFEYAANLLYVFVLRFLPTRWLALATLAAAMLSVGYVFSSSGGDYHGGWAFTPAGLETGFSRVLYTFMVGLLLSRLPWRLRVPGPSSPVACCWLVFWRCPVWVRRRCSGPTPCMRPPACCSFFRSSSSWARRKRPPRGRRAGRSAASAGVSPTRSTSCSSRLPFAT